MRGCPFGGTDAKICIVVEEADEVLYWLNLFNELSYIKKPIIAELNAEGLEILKVVSSIKIRSYLSFAHTSHLLILSYLSYAHFSHTLIRSC